MTGPPDESRPAPSSEAGRPRPQTTTSTHHRADACEYSLSIPEIAPDTDTLTAALAYAKAGWYVLPVAREDPTDPGKNPGSVVRKNWQHKSSRDPQQIAAWFAGKDHGIALHCGRSGAVVFDVDRPDKLPEVLRNT